MAILKQKNVSQYKLTKPYLNKNRVKNRSSENKRNV